MLKCERLNPLPLGLGTRQGFPPSPPLHHTIEPTQDNKARKRNKRDTDKGRNHLFPICRQHDHLCRKEFGIEIEVILSSLLYLQFFHFPLISLCSFPDSIQSQKEPYIWIAKDMTSKLQTIM